MKIKRDAIPSRTKKLIFQEARSQCSFCDESEVSALELHHIISVENGGSNGPENLILVCSSCHSKITQSVMSQVDVVERKRALIYGEPRSKNTSQPSNVISIDGHVSRSIVANTVRFAGKGSPRIQHPVGSVGANIHMKNYLDYLIKRYFEYRKGDASFGAHGHAQKFHQAEIHTSINSKFKAKTFFVPGHRFEEECSFIKQRIERTILGKRNKARGIPNYGSFQEFLSEQDSK
ncbi:MAG: HNH endonuclease [Acidobacteria bacterium]|nr:HNH endonuclease [Acidobacteriota bacterium]